MALNTSNGSVKSAGARKRQQFRDTRLGVLPNSIDAFSRLTLDPAMKAALTSAGAKLTVEIDAAGTRVYLSSHKSGEMIGGPEDLAKLGSIRAFVSRERKESAGVEVAKEVSQLAFKAATALEVNNPEYEQKSLDSSYGAAVRPLLSVLDRLAENEKKLEDNTNPKLRETFEPILKGYFGRIRKVYFLQILAVTCGENTKGLLQENLSKNVVPEYVHSKFTAPGFVLDRNQELARVLFPSDPSKGLALTLKEWRHPILRHNLGKEILSNSAVVYNLVKNDRLIRALTKIGPEVDLEDETNPLVAKLLKCRVAVVPPMNDVGYITEPASKSRGGWKFPTPSMDSIQGAIGALSIAILRVYSANMQSVDLVGDFYATIVPGSVTRAAVTPTNNFYVQWANAPSPGEVYYDHIRGTGNGNTRANIWRWIRTEMRLSEKADGGKSLANALLLQDDGTPREEVSRRYSVEEQNPDNPDETVKVTKEVTEYPPLPDATTREAYLTRDIPRLKDLQRPLTAVELSQAIEFQGRIFPSKKGKKKAVPSGNSLTKLTDQGQELVDEVAKLSPFVSERIKVWLRGFSESRLQRAAVKLAFASFDELFLQDDGSGDESDSDESDNGVEV